MPLVAITREMGSLAEAVAEELARALGCAVIHHEVIDYVADKMRLRKSHVVRLLEGRASLYERLTADRVSLTLFTAAETYALAARADGAVFLGWGAAPLLERAPHAVRVRICAPMHLRCERMKCSLGSDDQDYVLHEIGLSDEAHGAITKRHFGLGWRDAENYDLVLNTARLSTSACVDSILRLVRHPDFAESDDARQRLADLALEASVRGALHQHPETARLKLKVNVHDRCVVLEGSTNSEVDRSAAIAVARATPGVREALCRTTAPADSGKLAAQ